MAQNDLYDRDLAIQMKRKAYLKLAKKERERQEEIYGDCP